MVTTKNIYEIITKKATKFIKEGYIFSMDSMEGSDGTLRIDLLKNNHFIRIWVEEGRENKKPCLFIYTGERTIKYTNRMYDRLNTIWSSTLNIIDKELFYKIGYGCYGSGSCCYGTLEEYQNFDNKNLERHKNRLSNVIPLSDEKYVDIAYKYIVKQPRCKSIKKSDIKISKVIVNNNKAYFNIHINSKNKNFVLSKKVRPVY